MEHNESTDQSASRYDRVWLGVVIYLVVVCMGQERYRWKTDES